MGRVPNSKLQIQNRNQKFDSSFRLQRNRVLTTMNTLLASMQTEDTATTNGMAAHSSTLSHVLDLFSKMGSARGLEEQTLRNLFVKAFSEDRDLAVRAFLYNRDVRGGQGERRSGRVFFKYLCDKYPDIATQIIPLVVEVGRYDDLFEAIDTKVEGAVMDFLLARLLAGDRLAGKWMPREGKARAHVATAFRLHHGMDSTTYRNLIVGSTDVIETIMSERRWEDIVFKGIPSVAHNNYRKAFLKHVPEQYKSYLDRVEKGEEKINAGALYPYDITTKLTYSDSQENRTLEAQWKALPDLLLEGSVLPLVDVSGSMNCLAGSITSKLTCLDVAVSLGLYTSERIEGPFKDHFITFSSTPKLQVLSGSLHERLHQLKRSDWGMSTDIEAALKLILDFAVKGKVRESDMPKTFLILSDMQFNEATREFGQPRNKTALGMIRSMYEKAGYVVPKIVFWNLNARYANTPAQADDDGVNLVSGFSPSILKNVLGDSCTPHDLMLETLGSERYDWQ